MNGAESLVRTLLAGGVDTCFANPGTSEMHFVAALDRVPGMRCILGLFEGVVTGAADGYARMAGKPAATLLHCGPGLGNGLANLHNAKRAHVPLVNIVGDQATYHKPLDPLLAADTEGFARGVSAWVRVSRHAADVGADAAEAIQVARFAPGNVATLILPSDASWSEGGVPAAPLPVPPPETVDVASVSAVFRVLRSGEPTLILLGGASLRAGALANARRIAASTGAHLSAETFNTRIERGRGRPSVTRIPYPIDQGLAALAGYRHVILVNAIEPVAFFAYPGKPGRMIPAGAQVHVLASSEQDGPDALERLAGLTSVMRWSPDPSPPIPPVPAGAVTPEALAQAMVALMPENAIVVDEGLTFGFSIYGATEHAAPHDWLQLSGGAIGDGLPMATGAAIGASGRRVVSLQADGSALYTIQALWTQAREQLDVTTILLSNRRYAILDGELQSVGARGGAVSAKLFSLANPDLGWVKLAQGFGVEAARAETMEQFADLFTQANGRKGPFVIELATG